MSSLKPYQLGKFDYNECFFGVGGFLSPGYNEEKHLIALYLAAFAAQLAKRHILFNQPRPLTWLEPGIGDGSSTVKFIQALLPMHPQGFEIHGSDIQASSLVLAQKNLQALGEKFPITIADLQQKDAFSGERLAAIHSCDFALLSHFIYHLKSSLSGKRLPEKEVTLKLENLIQGISLSLKPTGFILAFHEAPTSDMFGTFAKRYSDVMSDATVRLKKAAEQCGKIVLSTPMHSKLYFPTLTGHDISALKTLANWQQYSEDTPQASWIKKFLFALHISEEKNAQGEILHEGGARFLEKEGKLSQAIEDLLSLLQKDEFGSYFIIRSEMQAILNSPIYQNDFIEAFTALTAQAPLLQAQARAIMLQETK